VASQAERTHRTRAESQPPGSHARTPGQMPAKGWWQITKRAWREAKYDQVPLLAAGVAFFGFLSLFPAMIAVVMAYGLVADPQDLRERAADLADLVPSSARDLVLQQVETLSSTPERSLGIGLVVALAAALWSASGGVGQLLTAINSAYDEEDTRGFVRRKGLAVLLTLVTVIFVIVLLGLVAVVPAALNVTTAPTAVRVLVEIARWLVLLALMTVALAVLYRVGPHREAPRIKWVSVGATVATLMWMAASVAFSVYVSMFGSYAKTYGGLAGVVVLMLWLWLSVYAILLGAEINAESEEQTIRDTTTGPERPLGQRGAVKADSRPPP
jgi:membrane protein